MSEIVNYDEIRDRFELALTAQTQEKLSDADRQKLLDAVDDSVGNNNDELVLEGDREVIVDGQFNNEGLSVSVYDEDGNVRDETWLTHAEIDERKDESSSDFTFEIEI